MNKIKIAPSILSADFSKLGQEIQAIEKAGADLIHFDVMDNHYVPNLTIGPMVAKSIKPLTNLPIDVHLMVKPVDSIIPAFAEAGASIISFHPETSEHIDRTISIIQHYGCKVGIALNPATPIYHLDYIMDKIDLILLMSVNPGFGGQKLIPYVLKKAKQIAKIIQQNSKNISLEMDGGIGIENIDKVIEAGVDIVVAGSAIFESSNYKKTIQLMRENAQKTLNKS